jgi:hypothetical protein
MCEARTVLYALSQAAEGDDAADAFGRHVADRVPQARPKAPRLKAGRPAQFLALSRTA